jgi:hypothetical protein
MRVTLLALALAGCFRFPIEGVPVDSGVPVDDLAMMTPSDLAGADLIGFDLPPVDLIGADLKPLRLEALTPFDVVGSDEVAIADFDNNGVRDLMVVGRAQNMIAFYAGNQSAAPYFNPTAAATLVVASPAAAVVSALNADGVPDVAFTSSTNNNAVICKGNAGAWPTVGSSYPTGMAPLGIAAGDLNGDGANDLAIANTASGSVTILVGVGDATFTTGTPVATTQAPHSVAIALIDNNAVNDLVITMPTSGSIQLSINTGNATFLGATTLTGTYSPVRIRAADIDNNNLNDLLFTNSTGPAMVLLQTSNLAWGGAAPVGPAGVAQRGLTLIDMDTDGDRDLVTTDGNNVNVMLNKGNGTFDPPLSFAVTQPNAVAVADLSGDGKPEVVVTSNHTGSPRRVTVLRNNF